MRTLALPPGAAAQIRLALYYPKGLADVAAAEAAGIVPAAVIGQQQDRFLILTTTVTDAERLGRRARTVDDARLLVAGPERISSQAGFAALCRAAAGRVREVLPPGDGQRDAPWSVTLSARSPVWRQPPAWEPAPVLARYFPGADPAATKRSPVDLRVQADQDMIHIALSLWPRPVGKRGGPARPGALRPTVAAALVRLAVREAGLAIAARGVYDPFCGTGTIAAEAAHLGLPVFASDIDEHAVELTRRRLAGQEAAAAGAAAAPGARGGLRHRVFVHDVRSGPPRRVSAGIVAGNLPWGQQVETGGRLALYDATARLAGRLLADGGVAALLTTQEDPLVARLRSHRLEVSSCRIGLLGQTPAIVLARARPCSPARRPPDPAGA